MNNMILDLGSYCPAFDVFKAVSWLKPGSKPGAKQGAKQLHSGFLVSPHKKYCKAKILSLVSGTAVKLLANSNSNKRLTIQALLVQGN